jgi:hypothetical protein
VRRQLFEDVSAAVEAVHGQIAVLRFGAGDA